MKNWFKKNEKFELSKVFPLIWLFGILNLREIFLLPFFQWIKRMKNCWWKIIFWKNKMKNWFKKNEKFELSKVFPLIWLFGILNLRGILAPSRFFSGPKKWKIVDEKFSLSI